MSDFSLKANERREYITGIIGVWRKRNTLPDSSIDSYASDLAKIYLTSSYISKTGSQGGLDQFRSIIMGRENDIRWKVLGSNVLRRSKLSNEQRSLVAALEIEPDLLSPMKESRYEPIHTKLLAYHLDPAYGSDLSLTLLQATLDLIASKCSESNISIPEWKDISKAKVESEVVTNNARRADICLTLDDEFIILIENKVDAHEGDNQINDYLKYLRRSRDDQGGLLVYLTLPNAKRPSCDGDFVWLTYQDLLRAWLPFAIRDGQAGEYLARYLKSIAFSLLGLCGRGGFDQWTFLEQRLVLDFIEE